MLNKNVHEIKKEIDENYSDIISYEEYTKKNTYSDGVKNYKFKVLLLKTKSDNKEFIKFMYSLTHDDIEIIDQYNSFDKKFQDELLEAASFPKNQHIFSQNILDNWFKPDLPYYISQNSHNGLVKKPPFKSTKNYLSEYNVFTRFLHNKIFTIETGLFKYIDNSFEKLGFHAEKLENKKNNKKNKIKNINKNSDIYEIISNMYRFFALYIKHTRGIKSIHNFGIDYLIEELMNFENIKNNRDDTFKYLVSSEFKRLKLNNETFLDLFFDNNFLMSSITLSNDNDFNFSIGLNWCTHSKIIIDKQKKYKDIQSTVEHPYILFPISPTVGIIIYNDSNFLSTIVNEKYYFNIMMKQSLLQYLSYMKIENEVRILINGEKNYHNYNKIVNTKGEFNHLQDYIEINVTDKSIVDLINEKIDLSIINYAQRIYTEIKKIFYEDKKLTILRKNYTNNIISKIEIAGDIQIRTLYFDSIANLDGLKLFNLDNGTTQKAGKTD